MSELQEMKDNLAELRSRADGIYQFMAQNEDEFLHVAIESAYNNTMCAIANLMRKIKSLQ